LTAGCVLGRRDLGRVVSDEVSVNNVLKSDVLKRNY
jgi:hypothetical protein